MLVFLTAILSTVFRIGSYLFLRVLPSAILRKALPVVYVLYVSSLYLTPTPSTETTTSVTRLEKTRVRITNGSVEEEKEEETIVREYPLEARPDPVLSVLFSIPGPARLLNIANLAINTVLFLFALDFVLYPAYDDAADVVFTRVGAVYPDSAKLVVRYPLNEANATENHVRVLWRQVSALENSAWHVGPVLNLTAADDWVSTASLGGLWPSTNYEYILADAEATPLPYPAEPIKFHTFPDPRIPTGSHFRFVVSSCATPNFPYVPFHGRRIKGFDLLADYLWPQVPSAPIQANATDASNATEATLAMKGDEVPPTEFMLFLGDFIYADVPMYFGDDVESYRRFYRRNYQSPSMRKVYERLPMFHTYDDHEIINNYVGQGNDSTPPFKSADNAFRLYNANANFDPPEHDAHYYDFRYGDVAFFVMDTRRYRSDIREGDEASRTMLGDQQLTALRDWLGRVNNTATFKFIVSSVPFTALWTYEAETDSWNPYTHEKDSLLATMHTVKNVILLSGDRHEFAAVKFNAEGAGHSLIEVSTSPMSMFWVPLVRTLRPRSERTVRRLAEVQREVEGGVVVEEVEEEVPQEEVLKYVPEGNYKWSTFEIDTRDMEHPTARLELMSDGLPVYELEIVGKPVDIRPPATGVEAFVPTGLKGVLDKLGLRPNRWF
ncbi:PhoD-like phosphatase-domain-containing protein [Phanerochaete sordida]|uniref:PhoD-like phosphatase-domain-containing protein n=1 Tax=Phanerochaete sordida TaxID=48140 RepID=A0A9P3LK18_9APHY|nr:PhoD-like phosphatase-domain-containing protein [Phanerochaete sordida]